MTKPLAAQQPALPGRSAASLAYCSSQFDRRLTTKELVFLRFVAPGNARVNAKKRKRRFGEILASPYSNWVVDGGMATGTPLAGPVQFEALRAFAWSRISRTIRPSEVGLYGFCR